MIYRQLFFLLLTMLSTAPATAGYNVELNTVKDWPNVTGKIAIVPATCPPDFDCASLNKIIAHYFAWQTQLSSVSANEFSQAMLEANTEQLSDGKREEVAEALGVQSFFLVVVGGADTKQTGAHVTPVYGGGYYVGTSSVTSGSIEVRVISKEGKLLAKATGFGKSGFRREKGVITKVFEATFVRLFPKKRNKT